MLQHFLPGKWEKGPVTGDLRAAGRALVTSKAPNTGFAACGGTGL
jgi:hypothetical protein